MADGRARVVVLGYIVRGPTGGLVWHHLQYVLGLYDMGHDVWFLEDSGDDDWCCYDPTNNAVGTDPTYGLAVIDRLFRRFGVGNRWAYRDRHRDGWTGPAAGRVDELAATADIVLNLSGINPIGELCPDVPVRVLVDTDPVFTQIRHLTEPGAAAEAGRHTSFFTFAASVGSPGCRLPDDGITWWPTRQPVVLRLWPVAPGRPGGPFRTLMQWDSYPSREHAGVLYGMKKDSFGIIEELPRLVPARLELAAGGAPRDRLEAAGWYWLNPLEAVPDPESYAGFIVGSQAELTVVKHGYAEAGTGWFSERSAAFLACGRPVVTQQTGFNAWLDADRGVLAFRTLAEAVEAVQEVRAHYDEHCAAARDVATTWFNASTVLGSLLERASSHRSEVSPPSGPTR